MARAVEGVDTVVHLAAFGSVVESVQDPVPNFDVNVRGTLVVLRASATAGVGKVVFASTGGAIMGNAEPPVDEGTLPWPISPYGASKLCGEAYCHAFAGSFDLPVVALRFANVYGPRQEASLEGGVVAIFLERLAAGEESTIFGDGEQTRDFIYVGDVVDGVLAATGHEGGVYNIGTGVETSVTELHRVCRRVTGIEREPVYEEARPGDIGRSVIDPSLAARDLGWQAEQSLEKGLELTWASLQEAGPE